VFKGVLEECNGTSRTYAVEHCGPIVSDMFHNETVTRESETMPTSPKLKYNIDNFKVKRLDKCFLENKN
jgi:hypothetical protein